VKGPGATDMSGPFAVLASLVVPSGRSMEGEQK
jgi:hypothetical protein